MESSGRSGIFPCKILALPVKPTNTHWRITQLSVWFWLNKWTLMLSKSYFFLLPADTAGTNWFLEVSFYLWLYVLHWLKLLQKEVSIRANSSQTYLNDKTVPKSQSYWIQTKPQCQFTCTYQWKRKCAKCRKLGAVNIISGANKWHFFLAE